MTGRPVYQPAGRILLVAAASALLLATTAGCRAWTTRQPDQPLALTSPPLVERLIPSNHRNWQPDQAVLPYAEIDGNRVKVHNIRNCTYRSDDEYVVKHYDRTFHLDKIERVDFIVVPFKETPSLAHTLLSFGFDGDEYVSVSVEARREKGEEYSPVRGALRQYELMYVVADERDVLLRRTKIRGADVYLYRTRATPEQSRELFLDVMNRVNDLYREPEFYDTLTNNCTSNLAQHINRLRPGKVNLLDPRALLPGYADQLAYDVGLLDSTKPFAQLRAEARINPRADQYADRRDFSALIRR